MSSTRSKQHRGQWIDQFCIPQNGNQILKGSQLELKYLMSNWSFYLPKRGRWGGAGRVTRLQATPVFFSFITTFISMGIYLSSIYGLDFCHWFCLSMPSWLVCCLHICKLIDVLWVVLTSHILWNIFLSYKLVENRMVKHMYLHSIIIIEPINQFVSVCD